jgi:nucleoside-diphosphate-sugar epimerase
MNAVIFGANGPAGRLATARALVAGHSVVAVTRQPREFPITHSQLTVAWADVRRLGIHRAHRDRLHHPTRPTLWQMMHREALSSNDRGQIPTLRSDS